jgi:hypothetical protein
MLLMLKCEDEEWMSAWKVKMLGSLDVDIDIPWQ